MATLLLRCVGAGERVRSSTGSRGTRLGQVRQRTYRLVPAQHGQHLIACVLGPELSKQTACAT